MWEAIAAKVDPNGQPVAPFHAGEPCAAYLGQAGAGHYVKMVHNGIEYADMQLICEAYQLMTDLLGMTPDEIGTVFERWNQGALNSYLMEISADILKTADPVTGQPFVQVVLDKAGQKGTGLWTAVNSLQEGEPAPTIAQAVFARAQSAQKGLRVEASRTIKLATVAIDIRDKSAILNGIEEALVCAKIAVYAQGFALMKVKSDHQAGNWIWRKLPVSGGQVALSARAFCTKSPRRLWLRQAFAIYFSQSRLPTCWRKKVSAGARQSPTVRWPVFPFPASVRH